MTSIRYIIGLVMGLMVTPAIAQMAFLADSAVVRLSEIEISASKTSTSYKQTGRVVSIIGREQLAKMQVYSVADVLDIISGVDLRQRGPEGMQADVSIRGGSFDQVLILLNGMNISDPQSGHLSLNLPIDLSVVERIEILEGPGARSYGPNAFSGAINFITGVNEAQHITTMLQGGSFGFGKASVHAKINSGRLSSFASANVARSDGHHENTDFKQHGLFYQGKMNYGSDDLEFQLGYLDKAFGAFAFYTPKYPNQFEQNRTINSSIKFSSVGEKVKITPMVYWRRNHDRFELFRNEPASWYVGHNYHMTDVFGSSLNGTIKWGLGTTAIGGEVRSEAVWSNTLGDLMVSPLDVPGEEGKVFTRSYSRQNSSVYAEHTYTYGQFTVTGGLVANHNSSIDYKLRFFPGIDASYWISSGIKIYGGVNSSLRVPTFTDLLYVSSTAIGNRLLKPEEVVAYEIGLKHYFGSFTTQIGAFMHDAKNLIDWGKPHGTAVYQSMNLTTMRSQGVQFTASYQPTEKSGLGLFVNSLSVDYLYLTQDKEAEAGFDSRYVMDYLKHKVVARLDHRIFSSLSGSWTYRYHDRMGTFADAQNNIINYKPVGLLDFQMDCQLKNWRVFAGVTNIFDVDYEDIGNVPQPGRWLRGGLAVKLGL